MEALFLDWPNPALGLVLPPPALVLPLDGSACPPPGASGAAAILWGPPSADGVRPQLCTRSCRLPPGDALAAEVAKPLVGKP